MEKELKIIDCEACDWVGTEDNLRKEFNEVEMSTLEHCPNCNGAWNLIETGFTSKESKYHSR